MVRRIIFGLAFGMAALVIAVPAMGRPAAQQDATPTAPKPAATATATAAPPTPTAYPFRSLKFALQAQATISLQSNGPVVVSAATMTLAPGAVTLDFTVDGTTIVAVQAGQVTVEADNAVVTVVDIAPVIGINPVTGSPGPLSSTIVNTGEQVLLPAGATASLRNDGAVAASLLLLAVMPVSGPAPTAVP